MSPVVSAPPRVAICQPAIIPGGRLRVIAGMVAVLNRMGVVPEIVSAGFAVKPADLVHRHRLTLAARWRLLPCPRRPGEVAIALFNRRLAGVAEDYDLLINTGNSLLFLPPQAQVLSYLFYPRKARVMSRSASIHRPGQRLPVLSLRRLERAVMGRLYRHGRVGPNQRIVCMTRYTAAELARVHPGLAEAPVIYPPVDLELFAGGGGDRQRMLVTAGRFVPDKGQLGQIDLARRLPDLPVHIVGFTGDGRYFRRCKRFHQRHRVDNVTLHPDLPSAGLRRLLGRARYFLHTTVAEPFGITAVQAMAAGCLPLVHDSGGQREAVDDAGLRFTDLAEVPERIAAIDGDPGHWQARLAELQERSRELFHPLVFEARLAEVLEEILGTGTKP